MQNAVSKKCKYTVLFTIIFGTLSFAGVRTKAVITSAGVCHHTAERVVDVTLRDATG